MPVKYPQSRTSDQVDVYHDVAVADPYRWLEDDTAPEVEAWVKAQNEVTETYLSKIPFREKIAERYTELFDFPKMYSPMKVGDFYFFYKNDGLQNQAVIYRQKGIDGSPEVFIDPNQLSDNGTVAITLLSSSKDNKYLAYAESKAGSDWQDIKIREVATGKLLSDTIQWVKFSGAAWYGNGFFYSRFPPAAAGEELSGQNLYHSVYYHEMGTNQADDKLIFKDDNKPKPNHYASVTEDGKYLIIYAALGTDGFELLYKDLSETDSTFITLFSGYDHKNTVVQHLDGHFLVHTDVAAPKYRLVRIDLQQPEPENWQEVIPESDFLLQKVTKGGGKIFAEYLENATSRVYQYDVDGTNQLAINLPGLGSILGFSGKATDQQLFYSFTSFLSPGTIFLYDIAAQTSSVFFEIPLKINPAEYVEKQVFYTSKDGTKVSMFLVHKKGIALDGHNPTFLYGYGGFNISMTPSFSASRFILLENGGVFAMPNLRGGGAYGEAWHRDGMLLNKQNVFDDFIAAAEFLISEKYTSSKKLAIAGGSNGGLLVGACMTQRPELFQVAFPAVGVLDMLRYHLFTIGYAWAVEYGSSDEKVHFENLLRYSPLHNLQTAIKYPSTMITTADHDDRVVPAHSFKFAAALQRAHSGENPVLISIATDAGHGAGKPTSKIIEEQTNQWAFFFHETNSWVVE
ncbi:MAG: prolyl oligopeptidase family serine peptidase [Bacteroidota bacterium]